MTEVTTTTALPETQLSGICYKNSNQCPVASIGGFQIGQSVMIGAGTPFEEIVVIKGFNAMGFMIFEPPLKYDHQPGVRIIGLPLTAPTAPVTTTAVDTIETTVPVTSTGAPTTTITQNPPEGTPSSTAAETTTTAVQTTAATTTAGDTIETTVPVTSTGAPTTTITENPPEGTPSSTAAETTTTAV